MCGPGCPSRSGANVIRGPQSAGLGHGASLRAVPDTSRVRARTLFALFGWTLIFLVHSFALTATQWEHPSWYNEGGRGEWL